MDFERPSPRRFLQAGAAALSGIVSGGASCLAAFARGDTAFSSAQTTAARTDAVIAPNDFEGTDAMRINRAVEA